MYNILKESTDSKAMYICNLKQFYPVLWRYWRVEDYSVMVHTFVIPKLKTTKTDK